MGEAQAPDGGHGHDRPARGAHAHGRSESRRRLRWALALVVAYVGAEVVGGLVSGSLALLADAGHMFSDAASLASALLAIRLAGRPPTEAASFGYHRAEVLAALGQGVALVLIAFFVFSEAYERFQDPPNVLGPTMLIVAAGGLAVNVAGLLILESERHENLNVRGAWLHVLADAAGSVGAIVAAVLIWWRGWDLADPIASVLIGLLVLASSVGLLRDAGRVLMQHSPTHVDVGAVRSAIESVSGVGGIHDLHVWTLTSGKDSLSVHVVLDGSRAYADVLAEIRTLLDERFSLGHCAVQVEPADFEEPTSEY